MIRGQWTELDHTLAKEMTVSFFVLVPGFLRSLHYVGMSGCGHLSPFQPH